MVHEKEQIDFLTGEIKKVNANFIQIYEDNVDLIIEIANENPTSVKVFLFLIKSMDDRNALVISQNALAEALNLHRNTIGNSVAYLKEKKALEVLKSGNTNIYAINSELAWKSDANSKKYAHFTAKVYISASEQENNNKPLFRTELFGHSIKKIAKKRKKINSEEAINNFEQAK